MTTPNATPTRANVLRELLLWLDGGHCSNKRLCEILTFLREGGTDGR